MKKQKRTIHEVNYWESMADSMIALLLCILLVMLLLMMYLVRSDDNLVDDKLGYRYELYDDPDEGGGNHGYGRVDDKPGDNYHYDRDDDGDDGGGGNYGGGGSYGEKGEGEDDYAYEDPDPGAGEGEGLDRAAVFVQVMDGETQRTIKKEGITFELYDRDALLTVLNTYYPKRVSYKTYKTDNEGVFFLPERIVPETYYLNCLTSISGYDTGENTYFTIDQSYSWEDPFVVNVMLYPSKNSVEVHLKNNSDGKAITGAVFQVVAAENITTADGTLRYRENTVVDTITVDGSGVGRSKELYLGSYELRQVTVPEYYGKMEKEIPVTLKSRTATKQREKVEIFLSKTTVELTAVDALYDTIRLPNTQYALRSAEGALIKMYQTNDQGRFTITDLKKNTTYRLSQESAPKGYQKNPEERTFRVSGDGFINGAVQTQMQMESRILRMSISVQDQLFRNLVSDVHMALLDMDANVVRTWTTSGIEQTIEGLPAGEYQLVVGGNRDNAIQITLKDQAELQKVSVSRWTTLDIAAVVILIVVSAALVWLVIWLIKEKKKRKGSEL